MTVVANHTGLQPGQKHTVAVVCLMYSLDLAAVAEKLVIKGGFVVHQWRSLEYTDSVKSIPHANKRIFLE